MPEKRMTRVEVSSPALYEGRLLSTDYRGCIRLAHGRRLEVINNYVRLHVVWWDACHIHCCLMAHWDDSDLILLWLDTCYGFVSARRPSLLCHICSIYFYNKSRSFHHDIVPAAACLILMTMQPMYIDISSWMGWACNLHMVCPTVSQQFDTSFRRLIDLLLWNPCKCFKKHTYVKQRQTLQLLSAAAL